eukprot:15480090-Alexandrium_andersonii.AAC.1
MAASLQGRPRPAPPDRRSGRGPPYSGRGAGTRPSAVAGSGTASAAVAAGPPRAGLGAPPRA